MVLNVLILVSIVVYPCLCNIDPLVTTTLGTYRGSILRNTFQETIFSFRGIKYAEAPIDKLRFKIRAHFEENEEVPDSIVLTSSPLPKKKMKNWFCNRGFSPPETNSNDTQVETELMKNSSSNQKCNSFKIQDRDEDINKKIVIHEIITIEPSPVISVSPTEYLGFQSYELNDTDNTTYEWKKKSHSMKTIKEIKMSSSEKLKDMPNDGSLYYAIDNKSPVPVKKHLEIYNATEDKPLCPQPTDDPISEDCLYLNVYSSELPKDGKNPKRAVIVFLHAGGYYSGTGRSNILGPQYFLNQDIVLVTLNYRLGTLGFLSTGDKEATGNYGLKDQVAALKWVKNNIEYFGGNKNCITLFGYSAGAMSVNLHLISPMSKGLFHRAIIGSLSSLGQLPIGRSQLDVAKRQARLVGCPDDTSKNIVDCLQGKSAIDLGNSLDNMFEFLNDPVLIWKPVIEEDYGQERFLTDHPIKLVLDGKIQNIPILSGITSDEFGFRGLDLELNANMLEKLDKQWEKYAPINFLFERHTERSKEISKGLRSFYFGDKKLDNSTSVPLTQIYNEGLTGFATNRAVKLLCEKSSQEVYYYRFSYRGKYSHYTSSTSNATVYGPVHHDDLMYLFYISVLFPEFKKSDNDFRTVQKLTTMWANFAKTGKPIPKTCGRLDYAEWEPFNLATQKYMDIGDTLKLKQKLYSKRYAVWEKLFPISRYNETENVSY